MICQLLLIGCRQNIKGQKENDALCDWHVLDHVMTSKMQITVIYLDQTAVLLTHKIVQKNFTKDHGPSWKHQSVKNI